jgi:hypothetical protein
VTGPSWWWLRLFAAECGSQLSARVDVEFGIGVGEVRFDRPGGDEEQLGDFLAGVAVGGHLRHAELRRGKGVAADGAVTARTSAGRRQLNAGSFSESDGATAGRQVQAVSQRLTCRGTFSGAAACGAQLDQRAGGLPPPPAAA